VHRRDLRATLARLCRILTNAETPSEASTTLPAPAGA
jgi:hypothetical protein